jgi:hypothetical protein
MLCQLPQVCPADDHLPTEVCFSCGSPYDLDVIKIAQDSYDLICPACQCNRKDEAANARLWRRLRSAKMRNHQRRVRAHQEAVDAWIWSVEGDVPQPVMEGAR